MTGQRVNMGNVLVIKTKFNLKIILTENRVMPFDDKHIKVFGINPKNEDIIVTKSGSAWKIAFGEIAKTVLNIDTDGICSSNLKKITYSNNNIKKYWPLNE
jgi:microcystin degradation protein MlrC